MKNDIVILAIESSCDETAAAVVKNGRQVLSNVISSQIEIHQKFGGVVPEIASRNHVEKIDAVVMQALSDAAVELCDLDAIAVTYGPGLVGALLTGLSYAKGLAFAAGKPMIGVNHIHGHICANYLDNHILTPPFICLVVSGGHTHILNVADYLTFEVLGKTMDDAAGEAYDKVARTLGLGYPGGPKIDEIAKTGKPVIDFPRAMLDQQLNFSFSGLKSAVFNYVNKLHMKNEPIPVADLAASFQEAVVDVLVAKTIKACEMKNSNTVVLAGGVSANSKLRSCFTEACRQKEYQLHIPSLVYCTDNAAMIASCAYFHYLNKDFSSWSLNADPSLKLDTAI